jgi:serine phosphatase RsbU (regulator of sigma subunit)
MATAKKSSDIRLSGTRLGTRFSLQMSVALAVVMVAAGLVLYNRTLKAAERIQEHAFVEAVQIQGPLQKQYQQDLVAEAEARLYGTPAKPKELKSEVAMPIKGSVDQTFANGEVVRKEVAYGEGFQKQGYLYQYKDVSPPMIVSRSLKEEAGKGLLPLILAVTIGVMLVGALVAWMVGNAVSRPLELIVDDIAQISRGDLRHRTRVRAGGEIMVLAKSIDRMASNLESAQAAELELSVREREIGLASEVREALLPESTPEVPGYDLAALHVDCPSPGGDFHDFLELAGGRIGILVCDVSGRGIPGAMIGAIARSYLHVELAREFETSIALGREPDVAAALSRVNVELARDVRRGMYVTALCAIVDPRAGKATIACAGHKLPLVRYGAADRKIRLVHPEGIALGFDKGAVFERTLALQEIAIEPGDRLLLATTGTVKVQNAAGDELGEKAFYRHVLQHAGAPTTEDLLGRVESALGTHAGGIPFPNDISIVALARKG